MRSGVQDGAVLNMLGRDFEVIVEEPDEDGHGYVGVRCMVCDESMRLSDDAMQDHECPVCAGCGEVTADLPVTDIENGQRFCGETCHEDASERYWTAVWTA